VKAQEILQSVVPRSVRKVLRRSNGSGYAEDGLETTRITDFLFTGKFAAAYEVGKATNSWGQGDLRWRVFVACWAAQHASLLAGDFVECGVNRGGMARAVMEYVNFATLDKNFYLLDTFFGIPDNMKHRSAPIAFEYSECFEDVKKTFQQFFNVKLVRGTVPDTLREVASNRIAYLSIDMNCAEPEIAAAEFFWDKISDGGVVVLDDYCYSEHYRLQNQAFNDFAKARNVEILALPTGQGLIFKSHGH